jgi:hypothetical protein
MSGDQIIIIKQDPCQALGHGPFLVNCPYIHVFHGRQNNPPSPSVSLPPHAVYTICNKAAILRAYRREIPGGLFLFILSFCVLFLAALLYEFLHLQLGIRFIFL